MGKMGGEIFGRRVGSEIDEGGGVDEAKGQRLSKERLRCQIIIGLGLLLLTVLRDC